jgi:oleandomycin transport system permease protein
MRVVRHSLVLAKRNLIGVLRNPEALIDVTLQPVIFIAMFTYIFGGAIADGSQHDYLQYRGLAAGGGERRAGSPNCGRPR